ncbi:MAK10-like protein [Tanacetum coccineum]
MGDENLSYSREITQDQATRDIGYHRAPEGKSSTSSMTPVSGIAANGWSFTDKELAIGLNALQRIHLHMGGSLLPDSVLNSFPHGKDAKLRNDFPDVQQHHGRISIDDGLISRTYSKRRTIDQSAGGKLRNLNPEESWAILDDLTLYDNESWNDPWDFVKPVKAIALPQGVRVHSLPGPHDTQYCMENPEQAFVEYASSRTDEAGGKWIVKDVEVHIGKLKLLNDFYVLDMKKDLETPLLVGRGFLATANAVIDCRMAKIAVGEGITSSDGIGAKPPYYARKDFLDCHLPGEWEISRDAELNPFKDTLVFRRMVEFLGAIPINLKSIFDEKKALTVLRKFHWYDYRDLSGVASCDGCAR